MKELECIPEKAGTSWENVSFEQRMVSSDLVLDEITVTAMLREEGK